MSSGNLFGIVCAESEPFAPGFAFLCSNGGSASIKLCYMLLTMVDGRWSPSRITGRPQPQAMSQPTTKKERHVKDRRAAPHQHASLAVIKAGSHSREAMKYPESASVRSLRPRSGARRRAIHAWIFRLLRGNPVREASALVSAQNAENFFEKRVGLCDNIAGYRRA